MRVVVDTNILVRALIKPQGTVGPVVGTLRDGRYVALYSKATLEELVDVTSRPRLRDKFGLRDRDVKVLLRLLLLRGEEVEPDRAIVVCRDPKDDKFLEVAAAGEADVIVTGDEDLLILSPFEGIPIIGPFAFLRQIDD